MKLFESRKEKFFKTVLLLFPLFLLLCIGLIFFIAIGRTSDATIQKEQSALLQTLENGAVRTYALKGQYPESLDELLSDYHITYDSSKFVIEYVPNGSNLLPSISVIPLTGTNSERRIPKQILAPFPPISPQNSGSTMFRMGFLRMN